MSSPPPITNSHQAPTYSPFGILCEQHVDDVTSQWEQWQTALEQPLYDANSLGVLEKKIRSNIAGMMSNADNAWTYSACKFPTATASDIFTATHIAFRSYKTNRIRDVINITGNNDSLSHGLISALTWLPKNIVQPWLTKFLKSKDLTHKTIALKACRLRNEAPQKFISRFLENDTYKEHRPLYAQSLRIAGDLKIFDTKKSLYHALTETADIQFWALHSLILIGEHHLALQLTPYIFHSNTYQTKAIELAFRVLPIPNAWELINELKKSTQYQRATIQAISALADPLAIPWLIEQMKEPTLARISGEAFYNITGINLDKQDLSIKAPYSTDDILQLEVGQKINFAHKDQHLPWPDANKVWVHWHHTSKSLYEQGQRYFLGEKISIKNIKHALNHGRQHQRRVAALELALAVSDCKLYNTHSVNTHE